MAWMPDPGSDLGSRLRRRLRDDLVVWLTTVAADGTPQPNPVWFIAEGEEIVVFNRRDAKRLVHVRTRPRVSLNFNSTPSGGDVLVIVGEARRVDGAPLPHQVPAYVDKYGEAMQRISGSLAGFSDEYPVLLRIRPDRVRD
jgi:PPOX class probable F420-dependent enzyme